MTNQINNQSRIPSTDVIQLTLTLKMTTAQVVETSVTVNNNSPIQNYVHPDDQSQPTFEMTLTWDQAQFERFWYILSNGYRWNWAWYKLIHVCARYGQILAVTLIGCRKRRKLKALIPRVVVFGNDPSSAEKRIHFAVFFIVLWSYGRKICLNMCHGNSENSYGCSYLLRICFIYGKWVYRGVESLCKLLTANKVHFDLPANGCKSKYCPS